jgi:hypothetical protein
MAPRACGRSQRLTSGKDTWSARCVETCTAGAAGGPGKPTGRNPGRAPRSDPTKALDTGGALTAGFDQIKAVREAQQQATARAAQQAREAHALAALTAAQHDGDIATRVTTIQPCPQCQHPVTVLTTLIPSPPSPSRPA